MTTVSTSTDPITGAAVLSIDGTIATGPVQVDPTAFATILREVYLRGRRDGVLAFDEAFNPMLRAKVDAAYKSGLAAATESPDAALVLAIEELTRATRAPRTKTVTRDAAGQIVEVVES